MTYKKHDAYLITINDVTAKLKIEEALNLAEQKRQKDIIEAEENSRSQIGMELHDNVNQILVALLVYLQRIETADGKSKELLSVSKDILGQAIEEIRKLSASLVPPILSFNNLKESIESLCRGYELVHTDIELNIDINEDAIPQGLKTNIYRILQEQFSNITKYANASKINITLVQHPGYLELEIADNGKGFNLKAAKSGIGLTNITYRAKAYGGKISIITGINKGCKINIRFNDSF
jgi:signal transduction histidine kinase